MAKLDQKVEQEAKNMNLSTVRLCFQTYVQNDQGHFVNALEPVYSHQIYDSSECRIHSCKNIRQFINFVVIVLQACYLDDNFIHKLDASCFNQQLVASVQILYIKLY